MPRGFLVIAQKEFSGTIRSKRFIIIIGLFVLLYAATLSMTTIFRVTGGMTGRFFMGLGMNLTSTMSYLAPILGIALGYDAISGEREKGSLKLLLSRPLYREEIINGKIIAALVGISIAMFSSTLISIGVGISLQGVTPTADEIMRLLVFVFFAIIFAAAYYMISLFFSTLSSKSSRSTLLGISVWALFTFILPIASNLVATAILGSPPAMRPGGGQPFNATQPIEPSEEFREYFTKLSEITATINAVSINHHFSTIANSVLTGEQVIGDFSGPGGRGGGPEVRQISIGEALSTHWTNLLALLIFIAVFFAASYLAFTRKEEK